MQKEPKLDVGELQEKLQSIMLGSAPVRHLLCLEINFQIAPLAQAETKQRTSVCKRVYTYT